MIEFDLESCAPPVERSKIGWFCSYTPEEIILSAGLEALRVSGSGRPIEEADAYLHNNLCPYVRSLLDLGLDGKLNRLDGLVFVNSCDAMRRLYDVWRFYTESQFTYIIDLPRIQGPETLGYYLNQLKGLIGHLERTFGVKIKDDALHKAIKTVNQTRRLLRKLYEMRGSGLYGLGSKEVFQIVQGSMKSSKERFNTLLEEYLSRMEAKSGFDGDDRPRILLSGSIIDRVEIVELIEEAGAFIVAEDLCTGSRYFDLLVEEDGDPLQSIAKRYIERPPCSRMKGPYKRFDYIFGLIEKYRAEGVIYYALKFCDQYQYDYPLLERELEKRNIPVLYLEGDYTTRSFGQIKTRAEAFLELLHRSEEAVV